MDTLFKERQHFRQPWLWIVLAGSTLLTVGLPLLLDGPGLRKDPWLALVLLSPLPLLVLFMFMRLDTEIRPEGIYVRFFPFQRTFREYRWDQIETAHIRQYDPIREYGGWGIKGAAGNKALNISGNQGLQLVLKGGKKLLIGTRKPLDIEQALLVAPASKS